MYIIINCLDVHYNCPELQYNSHCHNNCYNHDVCHDVHIMHHHHQHNLSHHLLHAWESPSQPCAHPLDAQHVGEHAVPGHDHHE